MNPITATCLKRGCAWNRRGICRRCGAVRAHPPDELAARRAQLAPIKADALDRLLFDAVTWIRKNPGPALAIGGALLLAGAAISELAKDGDRG